MTMVFVNRMSKRNTNKEVTGSVIISENNDDHKEIEESWYEGPSWEESLSLFRLGVAEKLKEGFMPDLVTSSDEAIPEGITIATKGGNSYEV